MHSLDIKFGLTSAGLLLLNHEKRLDPFEQLAWSYFFIAVYGLEQCLFFCISAKASWQCMLLSGWCTIHWSWLEAVEVGIWIMYCRWFSVSFIYFFLPSAFASVLWLLSVWEWMAYGCNWILSYYLMFKLSQIKVCFYKTLFHCTPDQTTLMLILMDDDIQMITVWAVNSLLI